MARIDEIDVIAPLDDGSEAEAGTLYPTRSGNVFRYSQSWLDSPGAWALFPSLPLSYSPFPFDGLGPFSDSAPDRWGRMLLTRANGGERLSEDSSLLGAADVSREGASRFRVDGP